MDGDGDGLPGCAGDCDDTDPAIYPAALEVCNGVDDDCDTTVDVEFDFDGDGWVTGLVPACVAAYPGGTDCDDSNGSVFPGAPELCNGADDDCVGGPDADPAGEVDADSDGALSCDDCDDANAATGPSFPELCDGEDNDCDGVVPVGELDLDYDGHPDCQVPVAPIAPVVSLPAGPTSAEDLVLTLLQEGLDEWGEAYGAYTVAWSRDAAPQPAWDDLWTVPWSATTKGEAWIALVTPAVGGPAANASATVVNAAPTVDGVTVEYTAGVGFRATPVAPFDADSDPIYYSTFWEVDSAPASSSPVYSPYPALTAGAEVVVTITPTDTWDSGPPVASVPFVAQPAAGLSLAVIDLGTRQIGCEIETLVTLSNEGSANLVFDDASIAHYSAALGFSILYGPSPNSVVAPGGSEDLSVLFTATDLGLVDAILTIDTNDPPALTVDLAAATEYGPARSDVVTIVEDGSVVFLTWLPVESTIEVVVNDVVQTTGWSLGSHGRSVLFAPPLVLGDVVEISYRESAAYCEDNQAPTADLQVLGSGSTCQFVTLSGLGSSDPDGDQLTYDWGFGAIPATSLADESPIASASDPLPRFTPDVSGDYEVTLVVSDPWEATSSLVSDTFTVTPYSPPDTSPPTADAGSDGSVDTVVQCSVDAYSAVYCPSCDPAPFSLDGSASSDDTGIGRYDWSLLVADDGETLSAAHGASVDLIFPPTYGDSSTPFSGTATIQLTVLDCGESTAVDTVDLSWTCTWLDP